MPSAAMQFKFNRNKLNLIYYDKKGHINHNCQMYLFSSWSKLSNLFFPPTDDDTEEDFLFRLLVSYYLVLVLGFMSC